MQVPASFLQVSKLKEKQRSEFIANPSGTSEVPYWLLRRTMLSFGDFITNSLSEASLSQVPGWRCGDTDKKPDARTRSAC